jgi:hypothetical protein
MYRSFLCALAVATAVGCSNGSSGFDSAGLQCGAPTGKYTLVYPAPNATGIPDNLPGIIFGSTNGLSASYQALVLPAGSSTPIAFEFIAPAPVPLPSPNAIPSFANPIYQESASGGTILPPATQVAVYLNDGNSNCTSTYSGSFTTQ